MTYPEMTTSNDNENTLMQGFKGSVYQTQTHGFNLDDTEDDQPVGHIGNILNTSQPTMEDDEDLLENELIWYKLTYSLLKTLTLVHNLSYNFHINRLWEISL